MQAVESIASKLQFHGNGLDFYAKQTQSAIKATLENNGLVKTEKLMSPEAWGKSLCWHYCQSLAGSCIDEDAGYLKPE